MNFTLCVLLVYNDNGSVQTLCTKRANARYAKCLHRPIVIINQQYTKGEIHFIKKSRCVSWITRVFEEHIVTNIACCSFDIKVQLPMKQENQNVLHVLDRTRNR